MALNMHSNLPFTVTTDKLRGAPVYRLKRRGTVPQEVEETLIYAVYKRRPLWDTQVHFYRNNTVVKILWDEVANETGLTDNQAKGRWKSLRDYYRLELKKLQTSGGEETKRSNWVHFQSMAFLKDVLGKKIYTPEIEGTESQSSEEVDQHAAEDIEEIYIKEEDCSVTTCKPLVVDSTSGPHVQEVPPTSEQQMNILNRRHLLLNSEGYKKALLDLERRRLDLVEKKVRIEEDDDFHYLKSLLPLIKMLPLSRRIGVRLKFQEIMCKEIEEVERNSDKSQALGPIE